MYRWKTMTLKQRSKMPIGGEMVDKEDIDLRAMLNKMKCESNFYFIITKKEP